MPETSTTATDDSADDASKSTTAAETDKATDNGTADTSNNPDASKSDDTTVVADDDKSKETTTKTDDTPASPKFDDDLDDWIERRGFPKPTTDDERKAFQDQRNEQRDFTKDRQAQREAADAKTLKDEMSKNKPDTASEEDDDRTDEEKRLDKIEADLAEERTTRAQSEFYQSNNVTEEEHKAILDIYKERVNSPATDQGKLRAFEYWSSPDALPDLLALAKAKVAQGTDTSAIEDEAARKERERIARESNAKSPSGAAKTTTTGGADDPLSDEARRKRFEERYGKNKS